MQLPLLLLVEQGPPTQSVSRVVCVIPDGWGLPPCHTGSGGGVLGRGLGTQAHVALGPHVRGVLVRCHKALSVLVVLSEAAVPVVFGGQAALASWGETGQIWGG